IQARRIRRSMAGYSTRRNGSIMIRYSRVRPETGSTYTGEVEPVPGSGRRECERDPSVHRGIVGLAQRLARELIEDEERTVGSAGSNFRFAAVVLRETAQRRRVLQPHRYPVPAEHPPQQASGAVKRPRDPA